jgi:glycosyltransferase involved in cell wall biosynthesis
VGPEVSVVVPVYRNRQTLRELHRRLAAALEGRSHQLVFVDDACPEGSRALLEELAAEDPLVDVVHLERNRGQHRAVLAGLEVADARRVVVLDADLQDPPEAIPALLRRLGKEGEGPAAVFAGRRGRYESRFRLLTSKVFKWALHVVAGVPPDAGLFVAMDRRMVEALLSYREARPFLVGMMGLSGLPLDSIPVERRPRTAGQSAYRFRDRAATGTAALVWAARRRLMRQRQRTAP